ncbi:MAG: hypothetical protein KatS3mg044_1231 [Rhodothermaceae bacterium]|nr:MAG: hypothetical protein KatS3mg044_1231 [Rhodothermaceae bacterium]
MKGDVSSISFKLQPQIHSLPAVLVEGSAIWLDGVDSTWHRIVRPSHYAPFGERSIIGALKSLPSVGLISGFQGLNVRGSPSDGFQVFLDGVPVYHPAHLFGLFDAFSPEALHAVGFYFDVAPSYYSAPPGGTLALRTRDERPPSLKAVAGFSNAAARLVFQGPFGKYGSLTIAGRRSIIDLLNWPGNEDIIAYGLDVGRPTGPLPEKVTQIETRLLKRGLSLDCVRERIISSQGA